MTKRTCVPRFFLSRLTTSVEMTPDIQSGYDSKSSSASMISSGVALTTVESVSPALLSSAI